MCGPKNEEEKKNNTTQVSSCHSPCQDLPMVSYISHVKSQGQGPLRSDPSPLMLTRFPSSLSLKHARLPSTPGLLHLLFLLPGMLFPGIHTAHSLTACSHLHASCHLSTGLPYPLSDAAGTHPLIASPTDVPLAHTLLHSYPNRYFKTFRIADVLIKQQNHLS